MGRLSKRRQDRTNTQSVSGTGPKSAKSGAELHVGVRASALFRDLPIRRNSAGNSAGPRKLLVRFGGRFIEASLPRFAPTIPGKGSSGSRLRRKRPDCLVGTHRRGVRVARRARPSACLPFVIRVHSWSYFFFGAGSRDGIGKYLTTNGHECTRMDTNPDGNPGGWDLARCPGCPPPGNSHRGRGFRF